MTPSSSWNVSCPEYDQDPLPPPSPSPLFLPALVLALFAIAISGTLILQHFRHYVFPRLQRHIARILLMVPVYAIASLLVLQDYRRAVYWNVARDAYEGLVITSFFALITQYLGPTLKAQQRVLLFKSPHSFPPPACLWRNDPTHKHFLSWSRLGVMQYVVVRVSTSLTAAILEYNRLYCPESMNPLYGHFWTTLANGMSMGIAMFTLITFYIAIHSDIHRYRPVLQFLSVKFVIFFGFWQGFLIKVVLASPSAVHWVGDGKSLAQASMDLQSLLTAAEMALASVIHVKAFDYHILVSVINEEEEKRRRAGRRTSLLDSTQSVLNDGLTRSPLEDDQRPAEEIDILDSAPPQLDWTDPECEDIKTDGGNERSLAASSFTEPSRLTVYQAFLDTFVPGDILSDLVSVTLFVSSRIGKLGRASMKAWSTGRLFPRWNSVQSLDGGEYATLSEENLLRADGRRTLKGDASHLDDTKAGSATSVHGLLSSGDSRDGWSWSVNRQDSFYSDPFSSIPGQSDDFFVLSTGQEYQDEQELFDVTSSRPTALPKD